MIWTLEMLETLDRMWLEGVKTSIIGLEVGVSASAVIGMAHRRKHLPRRPSPIRGNPVLIQQKREATRAENIERVRNGQELKRRRPAPAPRPVEAAAQTPAPQPLPRLSKCSWPLGEPGEKGFRFCGEKAVPGRSYCLDHCKIAYVKLKDRRDGT